MSTVDDIKKKLAQLSGWPRHHWVGLRVDSFEVCLPGDVKRPEALLACIKNISEASVGNPALLRTWKSLMPDGRLFLSFQDAERPWRSVAIFMNVATAMSANHLILSIDIHVPVGCFGDPTHYPVEESRAYRRETQTLFPSLSFSRRLTQAQAGEREKVGENVTTAMTSSEAGQTVEHSSVDTGTVWHAETYSYEPHYEPTGLLGWLFGIGPKTVVARNAKYVIENGGESRHETAARQSSARSSTNRHEKSTVNHDRSTESEKTLQETVVELSLTAVGVDFTKPAALLASWCSNSESGMSAEVVRLVQRTASSLAESIPRTVHQERAASNLTGATPWRSHELDDRFWVAARQSILVETDGLIHREYIPYNGTPRPIDTHALSEVLKKAEPQLSSDLVTTMSAGLPKTTASTPRMLSTGSDNKALANAP